MQGKILKVFSNDLYGSSDEREVVLFAAFIHKKYMNKYAIFTFRNEYDKNKLYFGSIHVKDDSIVIFNVRNEIVPVIDNFINQFETDNYNDEYEILDISNIIKIELVSYNEKDYDKLLLLDEKAIPKPKIEVREEKKKHPIVTVILILIFVGIGVFIYWYLNQDNFKIKNLECTKNGYHGETKLNYQSVRKITFDGNKKVKSIDVIETYNFKSLTSYQNFKDESRHYGYFSYGNDFRYNDEELKLDVIYQDKTVIDNYEKIKYALENDGYKCKEVTQDE